MLYPTKCNQIVSTLPYSLYFNDFILDNSVNPTFDPLFHLPSECSVSSTLAETMHHPTGTHSQRKQKGWRIKKATKVLHAFRRRKPKLPPHLDETPIESTGTSFQLVPSPKHAPPHFNSDSASVVETKHDSANINRLSPVYEHLEKSSTSLLDSDSQEPPPPPPIPAANLWNAEDLALCLVEILHRDERFNLNASSPSHISPKRKACQDLYVQLVLASTHCDTIALVRESADPLTALGALLIIVSKFKHPVSSLSKNSTAEHYELYHAISKLLLSKCNKAHLQQWCSAIAPSLYQSKEVATVGEAFYQQLQRISRSTETIISHSSYAEMIMEQSLSQFACAVLHYKAQRDTDLELHIGDMIEVHERYSDGWWFGRNRRSNIDGEFPGTFCTITTHDEWGDIHQICEQVLAATENEKHATGLLQSLYNHLSYRLSPSSTVIPS